MKSINTGFDTWEALAEAQVATEKPFELLGFDLENARHRSFWDKVRKGGKFNITATPKVKAVFLPATSN